MYDKDFLELDKLLKKGNGRSCYSIDYAEFAVMCKSDSTTRVLAKIFYWWRTEGDGEKETTKLRVKNKEGNLVLVKSPTELAIELGMSAITVKRAYAKLKALDLIATCTVYFRGHNTTGIILNEEVFAVAFWKAYIEIQLQLAEYMLSVTKEIYKRAEHEQRIAQLQDPAFDPRTDFHAPAKSKAIKLPKVDAPINKPALKLVSNKKKAPASSKQEPNEVTGQKNTPNIAVNNDESLTKMPRKKIRYD